MRLNLLYKLHPNELNMRLYYSFRAKVCTDVFTHYCCRKLIRIMIVDGLKNINKVNERVLLRISFLRSTILLQHFRVQGSIAALVHSCAREV